MFAPCFCEAFFYILGNLFSFQLVSAFLLIDWMNLLLSFTVNHSVPWISLPVSGCWLFCGFYIFIPLLLCSYFHVLLFLCSVVLEDQLLQLKLVLLLVLAGEMLGHKYSELANRSCFLFGVHHLLFTWILTVFQRCCQITKDTDVS